MTLKIPKVLVFNVVSLTIYILVNKLFPEKFTTSEKYPLTHLRHDNIGISKAISLKSSLKRKDLKK